MKPTDFRIWGLAPAWVIMALTLVVPIGIVILVSFASRGAYGGFDWGFSPASYAQILFEEDWDGNLAFTPQYLSIIGRTLWLAGLTTAICAALAWACSATGWLTRTSPPHRRQRVQWRHRGSHQLQPAGDHPAQGDHAVGDGLQFGGGALHQHHLHHLLAHQVHVQ